ncbi:hypothetical protein ACFWFZ_28450 [Streptomyces sp. NPDC060232]|uniref:hypothetical protein n=1 Tax=Streptomyces sp. NPDC060232 TaxID=3347079 RepID=UPI0036619EE1
MAGVLIAVFGAETVLLLDAATFGVSALPVCAFLRGVPAAGPQRGADKVSFAAYRAELAEGWAFLTRSRLLLGITVMAMMTNGQDQGWSFGGTYLLTTLAPLVFPAWRGMEREAEVSRTGRPLPGSAREERSPHPSAK